MLHDLAGVSLLTTGYPSMYRLAKERSLPGVDTPKALRPGIFAVGSTSNTSWVAPLRQIAAATYIQVYGALAK